MTPRPGGDDGGSTEDTASVRPYLVTRGRTAPTHEELPLETLVRAGGSALETGPPGSGAGLTTEVRSIVELTSARYLSVAELSAHVRLPVPVVRVVLEDLAGQGLVNLHPPEQSTDARGHRAVPRHVLDRVLDGITRL
jgi:hypothetical protein